MDFSCVGSLMYAGILPLDIHNIKSTILPITDVYQKVDDIYTILNYTASKAKQIRSPESYRRRHQQLEKGILLYAIVVFGTGAP